MALGRTATRDIFNPLMKNYDKHSRPFLESNLPVSVELQVRSQHSLLFFIFTLLLPWVHGKYRVNRLYNVDSVSNSFMMDVFFRLRWKDPRLSYNV